MAYEGGTTQEPGENSGRSYQDCTANTTATSSNGPQFYQVEISRDITADSKFYEVVPRGLPIRN